MKKAILLKKQRCLLGNVKEGSIYVFNENTTFYEYKKNGVVISTVNEKAVNFLPKLFKKITE